MRMCLAHRSQLADCESDRHVASALPHRRPNSEPPEGHHGSPRQCHQHVADQRDPRQQHRRRTIPGQQRAGPLHPRRCWRSNGDGRSSQPIRGARPHDIPDCCDKYRYEPAVGAPNDQSQRHLRRERQNGCGREAPGKENDEIQAILATTTNRLLAVGTPSAFMPRWWRLHQLASLASGVMASLPAAPVVGSNSWDTMTRSTQLTTNGGPVSRSERLSDQRARLPPSGLRPLHSGLRPLHRNAPHRPHPD